MLSDDDVETTVPGVKVSLQVDGGDFAEYATDADGNITVTLARGPHTLFLKESTDGKPVYVNNYSGSSTVTTNEGYYRFGFFVDAESLSHGDEGGQPGQPVPEVPETGDDTNLPILILLTVVPGCALVALASKRKRLMK